LGFSLLHKLFIAASIFLSTGGLQPGMLLLLLQRWVLLQWSQARCLLALACLAALP
jgi:hypothetical protein